MKKIRTIFKTAAFTITLTLSACDSRNTIAILKNNLNKPIYFIQYWEFGLTDSAVYNYYESIPGNTIKSDSSNALTLFNRNIDKTDTTNFVYIFNVDTLIAYQKKKKVQGLFKNALIEKRVVKLGNDNSIDTILVKESKE